MPDLTYILDEMDKRERGFAPHALVLYTLVRGLRTGAILEFGTGLSTRVILDALDAQDFGSLCSIGTDPVVAVAKAHGFRADHPRWRYRHGLSHRVLPAITDVTRSLDLILHDGAHDAKTVEADLRATLPYLRRYGLCLVHDTQHSNCGAAVRAGVLAAAAGRDFSHVTLPYGFGLTILRREDCDLPIEATAVDKRTSPHRTEPCRV